MTLSSRTLPQKGDLSPKTNLLTRKPVRITATLNWQTHQSLIDKADFEGRSLSNLISYILESYLEASTRRL